MNKLKALVKRSSDGEQGFTLIELMVVVMIIAIVIAIAILTFLGARQRAKDRAAQSDLRNGLTAEKTVYTDNQAYDATTAKIGRASCRERVYMARRGGSLKNRKRVSSPCAC